MTALEADGLEINEVIIKRSVLLGFRKPRLPIKVMTKAWKLLKSFQNLRKLIREHKNRRQTWRES